MNINRSYIKIKKHLLNHGTIFDEIAKDDMSTKMFDVKRAILTGNILNEVGVLLWKKIKKYEPGVLYGCGFGSVSVISAVKIAAEQEGYIIDALFIRDERKDTNRKTLIEGFVNTDNRTAIFVDDLHNSGGTYKYCLKCLKKENIGLNTVAIASVLDFESAASRQLMLHGLKKERLFSLKDLGHKLFSSAEVEEAFKKVSWRNLDYNQWNFKCNTAPKIHHNLVYYANDQHKLYCHDLENGDILWTFQGDRPFQPKGMSANILVSDEYVLISSYDGCLYKIFSGTGKLIWKKRLDYYIHSTPCIDHKNSLICIGTEGHLRGSILCLDLNTGETLTRIIQTHLRISQRSPNEDTPRVGTNFIQTNIKVRSLLIAGHPAEMNKTESIQSNVN